MGEIDGQLRCVKCFAPLSYPPIWQNQSGYSLCGRCPFGKEEAKFLTRAYAFEHLGKQFLFPCKNHNFGCEERRPINSMKEHEDRCYHRDVRCPTCDVCPWTGKIYATRHHCEQEHAQKNVKNPWTCMLETNEKKLQNFMTEFGYLFTITVDNDPPDVWHSVTVIDADVSTLFGYSIEIWCNATPTTSIHRLDAPSKFSTDEFRNRGRRQLTGNVHFKIELFLKPIKCFKCNLHLKSGPFGISGDDYSCRDCDESTEIARIPVRCKNLGCRRTELYYYDLLKHQIWFCRYVDRCCYDCGEMLLMESRMEHYKKCGKHPIIIPQAVGCYSATVTINEYILVNNPSYTFLANVYDKIFRICYVVNPENLRVNIVADMSRRATKNYSWMLRICSMDPSDRSVFEKPIPNVTFDKEQTNVYRHDWILFVFFSYTGIQRWSFKNNFLELVVKKRH